MPRRQRYRAFTLIELLVVITLIVLLTLMLAPALARTKPAAKSTQCALNQRRLSAAWRCSPMIMPISWSTIA